MLRYVGNLERFSTARHSLGYYRSVGNTARYAADCSPEDLPAIVESAVANVVLRHAALCCGIIDEDKTNPAFIRLDSIDLSQCIDYREVLSSTIEEYEQTLTHILEYQHRQLFPELHCRPGWRVTIVYAMFWPSGTVVFDAIFSYHHAIADGTSGVVFHRSMLKALNGLPGQKTLKNHILDIPESIFLPPPVERLINFKLTWLFFLAQLWKEFKPTWLFPEPNPPWASVPCSLSHIEDYKSRVKIISIPPHAVPIILAACREEKATLTGLLNGLITLSLARHVPSALSFSSSTPYSLRHLTGLSPTDEMAVQVSALSSPYSPEIVSSIRDGQSEGILITDNLWTIARTFRASVATELAGLPINNLLGLLPYVFNMQKLCTSRIGKPRAETFEVSNVGSFRNDDEDGLDGKWKIQRLVFSQSGNAVGPAISFNVVSVVGGPLTICLTWLEQAFEEDLADKVAEDLSNSLQEMGKGNGK